MGTPAALNASMSRWSVRIDTSRRLASSRPVIRPCACSNNTADNRRSARMNESGTPPSPEYYWPAIMTRAVIYGSVLFILVLVFSWRHLADVKRFEMKLTELFLAQLEREADGTRDT